MISISFVNELPIKKIWILLILFSLLNEISIFSLFWISYFIISEIGMKLGEFLISIIEALMKEEHWSIKFII